MDSTKQPLVSVLVPIYNVEKFLDQCLGSLAKQTYQNIEVICINDGSTDSSRDIIESYLQNDKRFRVVDKPNSGYGDSMNHGLDAATGKYISILESDDWLEPDAIEYMVGEAEQYQLEFLKCNFWLYWAEPTAKTAYRHNFYFELATADMRGLGVHRSRDYSPSFWRKASIWSALYLKSFLDENKIRFLPTPGASFQDTSFSFKVLACANRAKFSGRAFVHYRQDNGGSSVKSQGKIYCTCDEHAEIKRFLEEDRPDLKSELDPVRTYVKFLNYMWNYDRLGGDAQREFLDRFSLEMREEIEAGNIFQGCLDGSYYQDSDAAPYQYFVPEQIKEVTEVAYNPKLFAARHESRTSSNKVQTLKNYWDAGGINTVVDLVVQKARGEI